MYDIPWYIMYAAFICLSTGVIVFVTLRKLRKTQEARVGVAEKMEVQEAIETDKAEEDFISITRARALNSIEARFDFIRKILIPALCLIAILLIAIPIVPTISATYMSLLAGILTVIFGIAAKPIL